MQQQLRAKVITEDRLDRVQIVAGVDAWTEPADGRIWAAAAALRLSGLEPRKAPWSVSRWPSRMYLALYRCERRLAPWRHCSAYKCSRTFRLLTAKAWHTRADTGLACHIGLLAPIPAIGVATSKLLGQYKPLGPDRGEWTPLVDHGETVGAVLRTRSNTRPIFVSMGHGVSLRTAIDYVLRCAPAFRLPEPIRLADRLSRVFR